MTAGTIALTPLSLIFETITIDDNLTTERWWENMLQQKELYASEKRGK